MIAYISTIILWNTLLKRNIGEAMGVGWLMTLLLSGNRCFDLFAASVQYAATQEAVFAALAFVFMSYVMAKTGLVGRMVDILNSLLGRIAGGAGYVSTLASALFGLISGSGSANAASVGAITIPWMISSNWPREIAAVVVAGNAGLGMALPPSSSMFILLGLAAVSAQVRAGLLYLALLTAGLWTLAYRLLLVGFFVRKFHIHALPAKAIKPFRETLKSGWPSFLIFLGILLPIGLSLGPVAEILKASPTFGLKAMDSISLIVWIPIIISWIALFEGRRFLPNTLSSWFDFLRSAARRYAVVGATLFFAFAAGEVMSRMGLAADLSVILQALEVAPVAMIALVGILVLLVCGPLTSTASIAAIGAVAFSALVGVGVAPSIAAATVLIFSSTEGASPPNAAPIFIAAGIANIDPAKTFWPLIFYYVIPIIFLGILIALGILPALIG
ncbi:MAG: TRAP transporter large permease subunit [bacterium]